MENKLHINNIKFCLYQNTIYCKFYNYSDLSFSDESIEDMFCEVISLFSGGTYLPIIFDLTEVNGSMCISLFKFLSSNAKIKNSVLAKVFLVKNYRQKITLSLYVMFSESYFYNMIFRSKELATGFCNQSYGAFNSLTYQSDYGQCN